jgi:hypothetical protein
VATPVISLHPPAKVFTPAGIAAEVFCVAAGYAVCRTANGVLLAYRMDEIKEAEEPLATGQWSPGAPPASKFRRGELVRYTLGQKPIVRVTETRDGMVYGLPDGSPASSRIVDREEYFVSVEAGQPEPAPVAVAAVPPPPPPVAGCPGGTHAIVYGTTTCRHCGMAQDTIYEHRESVLFEAK